MEDHSQNDGKQELLCPGIKSDGHTRWRLKVHHLHYHCRRMLIPFLCFIVHKGIFLLEICWIMLICFLLDYSLLISDAGYAERGKEHFGTWSLSSFAHTFTLNVQQLTTFPSNFRWSQVFYQQLHSVLQRKIVKFFTSSWITK